MYEKKLELFIKTLKRQRYGVVGKHSAVKICEWTKKSIKNEGVCYKEKFYGSLYGIRSHTCLQMSPAAFFCPNRCVYCWRATEHTIASDMSDENWNLGIDDPDSIIDGCINEHRRLLSGLKGFEGTNMKKWEESQNPKNAAISLIGEPTAYPKIGDLVKRFNERGFTTFLVTNGMFPKRLKVMFDQGIFPTQLYLSLDAPTKEMYKKIDRPTLPDFWDRLKRTINLLSSYKGKKCVRLTMVKDWNTKEWDKYAKLIDKTKADFVEVKAYMYLGFSRRRLNEENMPHFQEIIEYASMLNDYLGYKWGGEDERSRVVLLKKK